MVINKIFKLSDTMVNEETTGHPFLKIHPKDNVLVALKDLAAGTTIKYNGREFLLKQDVKAKHKFFLDTLSAGSEVLMYGVLVGKVQKDVNLGEVMTTLNT